jgi:cytochrome c551/c552
MKAKNLILTLAVAINAITVSFAQDGEQIFKTICAACHTVGKGKLVGPDLRDVQNRHDMPWMLKWVKSSQTLVKAGDAQAVKLFNDNNKIPMPDVAYSEDQIKSVIGFITTKSTELASAKPDMAASTSGTTTQIAASPDSKKQTGNLLNLFSFTEYLLIGLLCLLLIVILVLSNTIKSLSGQLSAKIGTGSN